MNLMNTIFEDDLLIAVNKPSGQSTIPGRGDIGEALNQQLERERGQKVFVVHRLDREASGVVVFAKNRETHKKLCLRFERRDVKKSYRALVMGSLTGKGQIDSPLKEFGSGRVAPSKDGKRSLTHWSVQSSFAKATLLAVEPVTGRKHQIRAHLYSIGHAILGDPRYGPLPRPVGGVERLMLHASSLHLNLGREYFFEAPVPRDFSQVLIKYSGDRT
jgi:RluA family pseudouridine synthase